MQCPKNFCSITSDLTDWVTAIFAQVEQLHICFLSVRLLKLTSSLYLFVFVHDQIRIILHRQVLFSRYFVLNSWFCLIVSLSSRNSEAQGYILFCSGISMNSFIYLHLSQYIYYSLST